MNEYIQKYGQNAIQAYKKSLRLSQSLEKPNPSPSKQQPHLLPKKSTSKRSLKPSLSKRNESQTRLNCSKSIKNVSKVEDEQRKKGASFIEGSKKLIANDKMTGFSHTFGSKLNLGNRKKLTITESQTPKCTTPKLHINLNLNSKAEPQKGDGKDKLTERIQRSSGKKHSHMHTHHKFVASIEALLQQTLTKSKTNLRTFVSCVKECFEIILMNEQDSKIRKVFLMAKECFDKIISMTYKYKNNYSRALEKIHSLEKIHQTYLSENHQHSRSKSKHQLESQSNKKKAASIEMIILNENYDLRKKINKLEKELQYYSSQSASLMNVFGKFKNSQSQLRIGKAFDERQNQEATQTHLNKLQKRRSSENVFSHKPSYNQFTSDVQKRLSFDPGVLEANHEQNFSGQNSLYNSVSSSQSHGFYSQHKHHIDSGSKRNQKSINVQELSEEQDSSYER